MNAITDRTHPHRAAQRAVELAVLALPRGDVRRRYEREFVAELYGLDGRHQARHVVGVLVSIWSLRAAVSTEDYTKLEESMGHLIMRRPLLCRLNLRHHWQTGHAEDGSRYTYCSRCEKVIDRGRIPPGAIPG